jgi:hypothetical protein
MTLIVNSWSPAFQQPLKRLSLGARPLWKPTVESVGEPIRISIMFLPLLLGPMIGWGG